MMDGIATNDVTEMINKYKQNPAEWSNLDIFFNETKRQLIERGKLHRYLEFDVEKALTILKEFYLNQLKVERQDAGIKDSEGR